jgi:hypothetical protein
MDAQCAVCEEFLVRVNIRGEERLLEHTARGQYVIEGDYAWLDQQRRADPDAIRGRLHICRPVRGNWWLR